MSSTILNLNVCHVTETAFVAPTFTHRARYAVDLFNTLESFLLGIAVAGEPHPDRTGQGLLLCIIEHTEGLAAVLEREFPQFPKPLLNYIKAWNGFAQGSSLSPGWEEHSGFSFLENYLRIGARSSDNREDEQPGYHLGTWEIQSMPLAVWTGCRLERRNLGVPVVMIIGDFNQSDIIQFFAHCKGSYDGGEAARLDRLMVCPEWIYHDLYSSFMDWEGIWDAVRDRLGELDHEVHGQIGRGNILGRIESLNKATATNIMLRETLDVQSSSFQTVMRLVKQARDTNINKQDSKFLKRGKELLCALEHYQALANGNREQLQNLVSMMVSLEQISQGQSMARLNVLAFTFLPLSFVATLFGMTRFTISPSWYPAYALPMLVLTFTVAIALPKCFTIWEAWNVHQRPTARPRQKKQWPHKILWEPNDEPPTPRKKSHPPVSKSGAIAIGIVADGGVTERGRSLEKSSSNASLKHHSRRNSLQGSLKNKKDSGDKETEKKGRSFKDMFGRQ
ncbi:hypothetical protein DL98DRAFT_571000 [Cadophora sp. DSE1049]|nr:hypothetical protein DL98DRAFT_571000 [Cadophora sp. DSE1049]